MNALLVETNQPCRHLKFIAFPEFLSITDIHVDDEDRSNAAPCVVHAEAQIVKKTIRRAIESKHIVRDVHVTVVVDPLCMDRVTVTGKRCWRFHLANAAATSLKPTSDGRLSPQMSESPSGC